MEYVWVFERDSDRLEIRRPAHADELVILGHGVAKRMLSFETSAELLDFHMRFEEHLVRTGWRFARFDPERRSGAARRLDPRRTDDRRRLLRFPERS